ncbi:MAG: hypothetical protein RQ751_13900 [Longimicrobiales bacterium]|nr:hypothetical protein [Longimicrobiales bacterium]
MFIPLTDSTDFTLQVVAMGFVGLPVDTIRYRGTLIRRNVVVQPEPLSLEGLEVSVEAQDVRLLIYGFYDRAARGFGKFLDRDRILAAPTPNFTDVIRGTPGVIVDGTREVLMRRTGAALRRGIVGTARGFDAPPTPNQRRRLCNPSILVNGTVWRNRDHVEGDEPAAPGDANEFLPPREDILGVEVYNSHFFIPRELQLEIERFGGGAAGCGVILIWTR